MILTDANRAYAQIKERIITTVMRPGSVIQESVLMTELGLGRTPIREALKLIEAEELVVVSPRRGMFVAEVAISDLLLVQEIRLELDALCARLAVERITPEQLADLCGLAEEYHRCQPQGDQAQLLAIDRRFHDKLAEATRNPLLKTEFELFYHLSLRIWYLYLDRLSPDDLAMNFIDEILSAIETRDPARADAAMREHIRHFQQAIKRHL